MLFFMLPPSQNQMHSMRGTDSIVSFISQSCQIWDRQSDSANALFDKDAFLDQTIQISPEEKVVWKQWAEEFDVINLSAIHPANDGWILKEYAAANETDVNALNITSQFFGLKLQ